jgi:hypothetical protein
MTIENNFAAVAAHFDARLATLLSSFPSDTVKGVEPLTESPYLNIRIVRTDECECAFYVTTAWHDTTLDEHGNQYSRTKLKFNVDWASHSHNHPAIALKRARLYADVAEMGEELEKEFADVELYCLIATAEELAEQKARQEAAVALNAINAKVEAIVKHTAARKHLRVGTCKPVVDVTVDLPFGEYEHAIGGKVFKLTHKEVSSGATLTDLARTV